MVKLRERVEDMDCDLEDMASDGTCCQSSPAPVRATSSASRVPLVTWHSERSVSRLTPSWKLPSRAIPLPEPIRTTDSEALAELRGSALPCRWPSLLVDAGRLWPVTCHFLWSQSVFCQTERGPDSRGADAIAHRKVLLEMQVGRGD